MEQEQNNKDEMQNDAGLQEPSVPDGAAAAETVTPDASETSVPPTSAPEETNGTDAPPKKRARTVSLGTLISLLCFAVAFTMMLTYTLTALSVRAKYVDAIVYQQEQLEALTATLEQMESEDSVDFGKLKFLAAMFESASYYADTVSEEDRINAVLKAYAAATGDRYAEYYTKEEYAEISASNVGSRKGIGISIVQTEVTVEGTVYPALQVIAIFKNAPAASSALRVGDYIYALRVEDAFLTISALGGYTAAIDAFGGAAGTDVTFAAYRAAGGGFERHEFTVTRGDYVSESVSFTRAEADPTVGIVTISNFDLTTPGQFKSAVNSLLDAGVERFVFDVRNNPGGDLQSIKAVLTYFLAEGDLILASIDKDGNTHTSYVAEAVTWGGDYASCSVAKNEIGMYADLEMVVLCNANTASAAEVFTATLRDYGKAVIVGETTFGKGIMQTFYDLSHVSGGTYDGFVKMTTFAYVTKCGVSYHDVGIAPTNGETPLSEEAKEYALALLPQSLDAQLAAAIAAFN